MKINFSPQVRDETFAIARTEDAGAVSGEVYDLVQETLTVAKTGDALTINGVAYDFAQLPDGATLPREAVDCEYIASDVTRVNGDIELTLLLPITPQASEAARFPASLEIINDGDVSLPC